MSHITDDARSSMMSKVRKKHSKPEIIVRQLIHALGCRFALHRRDLPGTPDIVLPARSSIVQVHGCFWHQHPGCRHATKPRVRMEYWGLKLSRNVARDRETARQLIAMGWRICTVWECETKDVDSLNRRLRHFLIDSREPGVDRAR